MILNFNELIVYQIFLKHFGESQNYLGNKGKGLGGLDPQFPSHLLNRFELHPHPYHYLNLNHAQTALVGQGVAEVEGGYSGQDVFYVGEVGVVLAKGLHSIDVSQIN